MTGDRDRRDPEDNPFACSICGVYLGDVERATKPRSLCWGCGDK